MTTVIDFLPTIVGPFTFAPVLDDQSYNAVMTWALWGQRWYFSLYANSGPLIVARALIGSVDPVATGITTTKGFYTAKLGSAAGIGEHWSVNSLNVPDGTTLDMVLADGTVRLSRPATMSGLDPNATFQFVIDLVAGYGFASTMIFRASSMQFIIDP